jgi:hypothetical protein
MKSRGPKPQVRATLLQGEAKASLARGEGRMITQEFMQQLARGVKDRGRARLLAELTSSR